MNTNMWQLTPKMSFFSPLLSQSYWKRSLTVTTCPTRHWRSQTLVWRGRWRKQHAWVQQGPMPGWPQKWSNPHGFPKAVMSGGKGAVWKAENVWYVCGNVLIFCCLVCKICRSSVIGLDHLSLVNCDKKMLYSTLTLSNTNRPYHSFAFAVRKQDLADYFIKWQYSIWNYAKKH